ncbi:MAG: ATP-dependent sacrificial sulfur transferase LarE [Proteobacteria bacterium]|nr:ATP-dependent sacrificial sulfur transferase LarE [Pseudomonadota bacterium]
MQSFFAQNPRIVIAFSGGCDSSFLLYAAVMAHVDVRACVIRSAFQTKQEYDDAVKFCKKLGISLQSLELDVMSNGEITKNTRERCYYCKRAVLEKIREYAESEGIVTICEGTNASDDNEDRPGWRAVQELGVHSPLRSAGFSKPLIRHLSLLAGLSTATKPSNACLATRIPHGTCITLRELERVENAENRIRSLGFDDFRVRIYYGAARIQFNEKDWGRAMNLKDQIRSELIELFDTILIDTLTRT